MKGFRFYSFITIAAIGYFQIGCVASRTVADDTAPPMSSTDVVAAVKNSGELFIKSDENISNLREAVRVLKLARNPAERNFAVEWNYARYNYFLGKRSDDEAESDAAFKEGALAGKLASRIEPEKPDGHFWYGANLGEMARRSPLTVGLTSIDDIRAAMLKVIEIQPDYQGASAYHALSEVEMATALTDGKPEKAVEFLEKALELEKNNPVLALHLAKAYLAVDRAAEAKEQLTQMSKLTPVPGLKFEYDKSMAECRKLLQTRF